MGRYRPLIPLSHHINKCEQNYKEEKKSVPILYIKSGNAKRMGNCPTLLKRMLCVCLFLKKKKWQCRYSALTLFIQCICNVHLQWKFGEALCLFFFFKFRTVAIVPLVATMVTFFFFLSSVCTFFFLLYVLFYWYNKFHNIFKLLRFQFLIS